VGQRLASKLLLIGWDAADWKHITPLLDQGLLPTLDTFINEGVMGNIATLQPSFSPMLWTSIATGKWADEHGILGFTEPDPVTGQIRPVSSTSRKVKAIWNILTQRGLKAHVVGWWASHPAEPINGVAVSDLFPHASAPLGQPWPMPDQTVHPSELADVLALLRLHPGELNESVLLPFVPLASKVDQDKDKHLATLAKIIAECCSIHNAATWILENREWDFLGVYDISIDHFCHAFMTFHPPRMERVSEDRYDLYKDVIAGAYRFHDMLLARLLELAGPDATVMIVSDHGFHSDHLRPSWIPGWAAGPAVQHRPFGIFCLKGPHVRRDERVYGVNLLDVTPTILHLFGLPVGRDMPGRALVQALEESPNPESIPSWELEPGDCGMHPDHVRSDPASTHAMHQQLVALGYVEALNENQEKALANLLRERNYNLAEVFFNSDRAAAAAPLLEDLARNYPKDLRLILALARCQWKLGRVAAAKQALEPLLEAEKPPSGADLLMGTIRFEEGDARGALEHLLRAEEASPQLPSLHLQIGSAYLKQRRWSDAARAFAKALTIDPDSPHGHLGLAVVHLREHRGEEAVDEALTAVGLLHFLPLGHFYLGVALMRLDQWQRAALAFETSVSMAPGIAAAHRFLARIYEGPGGDRSRADTHRRRARELLARRAPRAAV
jgi:predicted AlkP superfamily phosphohydrolase/phosphomutase/tetratricopeptide (TPR) repeat protein